LNQELPYLSRLNNRHNNLAPTQAVTRNMARKLFHIPHHLRRRLPRCGSAHASPKRDALARDLALEGAKEELRRIARVGEVEACPVHGAGGGWQSVVRVPEERCRV